MKAPVLKRFVCYTFVLFFTSACLQAPAYADIVTTDQLLSQVTADSQRQELQTLFAREDVARQLTALGVDAADAAERVAGLSDAEVSTLYSQMADLPAGSGALGTIALVLVILILLDLTGLTDIFPKI